jgi:hypothetical protein
VTRTIASIFVLETFGVPAPRFVADVSPKVRDVMAREVISVPATATVAEALGVMDERNYSRAARCSGSMAKCEGLVSVFKMTKFFFPSCEPAVSIRGVFWLRFAAWRTRSVRKSSSASCRKQRRTSC